MARLRKGEREKRKNTVASVVHFFGLGLTEDEIAQETGLDRRTVNTYLHELDDDGKAHKKGRKWWPF